MAVRTVKRRQHPRHLKSGRVIQVCENWAVYGLSEEGKNSCYRCRCPVCGAKIISVNMPNGGTVHFEAATGLTRVKHPCLHRGEGLSRARDALTPDLFEINPASGACSE
jgi:hypothetical protein